MPYIRQTVNLLAYAYEGSNPSPTTTSKSQYTRVFASILLFGSRKVITHSGKLNQLAFLEMMQQGAHQYVRKGPLEELHKAVDGAML